MVKINGEQLIEPEDGPLGYGCVSLALVNSACNFFFQRRGMSHLADQSSYPSRYKCGKKRPEGPRIVRIKKTELSRSQSKIENRDSKIPQ
jgi:hypothetical protein